MHEWVSIDSKRPDDKDLVIFYVPLGRYVWGVGSDYDQIKGEYPTATHWSLVLKAPFIE